MPVYSVSLRSLCHDAVRQALCPFAAPVVLDATAGNGHDTLFLAQCAGPEGRVWAFDVQEKAVHATRARLRAAGVEQRVHCLHAGHELLSDHLPPHTPLHAALFNLGYLPGSPKGIVTQARTTLAAATQVLDRLVPGGLLSLHIYTGQEGGQDEAACLLDWAQALPYPQWQVLHLATANKRLRPEHLLLITAQ